MKDIFEQYKYSIIGGCAGILLASLFFTIGFWKSIISIAIVAIGIFIGFSKDKDVNVKEYFDDFWTNKKDWK